MVTEFGMSDRLGPLSFGKRDELVFLGREIGEQRNYSDEIAKTIDEEVRAIVDRAFERASQVLEVHRDRLDALAAKLIAEETVDREGFEALFSDLPAEGGPPRPAAAPPSARRRRAERRSAPAIKPAGQAEVLAGPEPRLTGARRGASTAHTTPITAPGIGRARSIPGRGSPAATMPG